VILDVERLGFAPFDRCDVLPAVVGSHWISLANSFALSGRRKRLHAWRPTAPPL
jgi:hypothetical protein